MDGEAFVSLNPNEARAAAALFERLFPEDGNGPGATQIGVVTYLDRALAGPYREQIECYRLGLAQLDNAAQTSVNRAFADCPTAVQDELIARLERGDIGSVDVSPPDEFFE